MMCTQKHFLHFDIFLYPINSVTDYIIGMSNREEKR